MSHQKIDGIYQYCDRWCERCTFTSRCAIYEDTSDLSPEALDINNKAFWERIGQNFAQAQELLKKAVEEMGVEPDSLEPSSEDGYLRRERLKSDSRKHPLAHLSLEYSKTARDWLKTQPGMLDRLEHLKTELTLGVESEDGARKETGTIADSLAVIQWYLVFIHVKLSRALMEKSARPEHEFPEDARTCDGSAKVAIIAMDRSINAWSALFEILPEHEDYFLKVLSMLQRVRTMAVEEFPGALTFVRPGLDGA